MVKLGAISRISAGYGFPKSEQGHSSGEYPFYKVSDMNRPGNQVFLEGAANYLSGPDIRRLKIVPFPAGAIVFPKIGAAIATNKKRILSCPSLVDNNVAVCIPEGVDGKYLYYWFLEHDLRVVAHDSGAVPSIRKTDLEQLDVPVPSVAEQERIVEVLDRFNAPRERHYVGASPPRLRPAAPSTSTTGIACCPSLRRRPNNELRGRVLDPPPQW